MSKLEYFYTDIRGRHRLKLLLRKDGLFYRIYYLRGANDLIILYDDKWILSPINICNIKVITGALKVFGEKVLIFEKNK